MDLQQKTKDYANDILHIEFNQDNGCFVCALENGFVVYNTDPLTEKIRRTFEKGIGYAQMLFRCNYLALVGGGARPQYSNNKAIIWDDLKKKVVIEIAERKSILAVKLRNDRIVVVLDNSVKVYSFTQTPQLQDSFETCHNPRGLCVLCGDKQNSLLAFPAPEQGEIKVVNLSDSRRNAPAIFAAHEANLRCFALNLEGTRLATASERGTLVRVFDTQTGKRLHELRRGTKQAEITCLNFNSTSTMLCASSEKGTVHLFDLEERQPEDAKAGRGAGDFMPKFFNSQWSFTKFKVTCPDNLCAFTPDDNAVIAVCGDGTYVKGTWRKGERDCQTTKSSFLHLS